MESNRGKYLQTKVFGYWGKKQYTSNVEFESTRTERKSWVELFFGVKVIVIDSGRRMGPIMEHTMHYRRMIITLQSGYSILPLRKKRTF